MIGGAIALVGAALAASAAGAAADPARFMPAELIAASLAPAPGSTILVGFRMTPRSGWHGYWRNPGDAGIAPSVRWQAPAGVRFGPLLHPAPTLITADGIGSYVHDGEHILLARMTIPHALARGSALPLAADLSWAACTATQCVPLRAKLTLGLTVGNGGRSDDWLRIRAALAKVPRRAPDGGFVATGNALRLLVPSSLGLNPASTRFFANDPGVFDTASARSRRAADGVVIAGRAKAAIPASISGVVSDGRSAFEIKLLPTTEATASAATLVDQPTESSIHEGANASVAAAQPEPAPLAREASPYPGSPARQSGGSSRNWMIWLALAAAAIGGGLLAWRRPG